MPHIRPERKKELKPLFDSYCTTAEELSYQILSLVEAYIHFNGKTPKQINDILGALEYTKVEFNNKITIPTLNKKEDNGLQK